MTPDPAVGSFDRAQTLFHRALEVKPEERGACLADWCAGDEALLREVQELVDAFEAAEAVAPVERIEVDPWIGRQLGAYRLERLLGTGGMGAVYLGTRTDGAFQMNVAVKVLGSRCIAPVLHERILMERQILAGLEHSNIARLIDGGITDDGEVYVVMEYVDGPPLDRYAAGKQLEVREILRLFLKVCDAIEYAHRKLVLHRDLKPANILVGQDGEPKLLDFGNAKLMEADSAAGGRLTKLGFRAFTPEFASPEQVLGGPVMASCDVYSLGVILYRLVTGKPPYEFKTYSSGEFVTILRDVEPPPPSASRQVDADVDAIVMKALQKQPEQRYPTVAAFSEDVRRFLDGRPISAREATWRYRAAKFAWRRRHAIAASAAAGVVLATGLTATVWQARRARAEEHRANRQFRNIRELNHALLFDFYDAVQALPGSTDVQRALVTESISYMDRLRGEAAADRDIATDVIEAFIRLGNLQGNPYSDNLSEPAQALATLGKALNLATELERGRPGEPSVRRLMALAEQGLGEVYFGSNDRKSAAIHLEMAARLMDEVAQRPPLSAAALVEAAAIHGVLGDIDSGSHGGVEDTRKAMARFERAEQLQAQALSLDGMHERARRGVAISKMKRAGMMAEVRPTEAAQLIASALEDVAKLPEQARSSMPNLRLAAMLHTKLAATLPSLGMFEDGTEHAREGLRIHESLAALDPENARTQVDLANSWFYYAEAVDYRAAERRAKADYEEARRGYRKALEIVRKLLQQSPGHPHWQSLAAEVAYRLAVASHKIADDAAARSFYDEARALTIPVADLADAGESQLLRAAILFSSEEVPASWRDLARARRYAERLNAISESPHHVYTLARICRLEGKTAEARAKIAKAESLLPPQTPGQPRSYLRRQIEDEKKLL